MAFRSKPTPSRRVFIRLEKYEQAAIVRLLNSMGAEIFVLGTRRPRAAMCRTCHVPVQETQGTRQTPGLPDLLAFLKRPGTPGRAFSPEPTTAPERDLLVIECKRYGTKPSPEQMRFQQLSGLAGVRHIVGTLDDVISYLVSGGYLKGDRVDQYRRHANVGREPFPTDSPTDNPTDSHA